MKAIIALIAFFPRWLIFNFDHRVVNIYFFAA